MLEFLKRIFGTTRRPSTCCRQVRLMVETFESRDLPSANPMIEMTHHFGMGEQDHFQWAGPTGQSGASDQSYGCHSDTQTLSATLSGATGTSGNATFTSNKATGDNELDVQVSGLSADTTYSVTDGTTTFGTITTDDNGAGNLSVTGLSPALAKGATISVLDSQVSTVLSGTLACGDPDAGTHLSAALDGADGTSGSAHFWTDTADSSLKLRVSGLTADTTYTIQVDSTTVGQVTTDDNGDGKVTSSDPATTIAAGSVVTIQDDQGVTVLQGTFEASQHYFRNHDWM